MKHGFPKVEVKNINSRIFLIGFALFLTVQGRSAVYRHPPDSLHAEQLIIVVTDNWTGVAARLFCFEKQWGKWQLQFSFPAVVGQNGMATGEGIRSIVIPEAPQKKEGDMKSPAGIFFLGPAFGYAEKSQARWIHLPYIRASDTLLCIDDPHSGMYNKLVRTDATKTDWHSHEEMHRKDDDYKWGIFVQHNDHSVKPSMGSCIFLHIWEGAQTGTAGCTAMEEKNMVKLLQWIRVDKHPLLVQFPLIVYNKLHADYFLPDL
jgi:L,D-peptidoglycan transpeptidase YkuD (ErfK/YbiS/YcfS/YnhG family)